MERERERTRFSPACSLVRFAGLICAEGDLWKDQRRFVAGCLKNLGMVKFGSKRDRMEERILVAVNECISVYYRLGYFARGRRVTKFRPGRKKSSVYYLSNRIYISARYVRAASAIGSRDRTYLLEMSLHLMRPSIPTAFRRSCRLARGDLDAGTNCRAIFRVKGTKYQSTD